MKTTYQMLGGIAMTLIGVGGLYFAIPYMGWVLGAGLIMCLNASQY